MRWILSLILNSVALIVISGLFGEKFYIAGISTAIVASIVLSVLNVVVKPFLIFITLPVTILTLGLFLVVINAATLSLASWIMSPKFHIDGFGTALMAAILLSILNGFLQRIIIRPLYKKKK